MTPSTDTNSTATSFLISPPLVAKACCRPGPRSGQLRPAVEGRYILLARDDGFLVVLLEVDVLRCHCLHRASFQNASSTSANSFGRLRKTQWPPSISSGEIPKRSDTTRRVNLGGNRRSSRHRRYRVGTSGHVSSGHGSFGKYSRPSPPSMSAAARSGGTSW